MSGARRGGGGAAEAAAGRLLLLALLLYSLVQCASANTENKARLTTGFGKPQQKPQENRPPKQLDGLPCNKSKDCNEIANTSCIADPRDGRLRCLCGDKTSPKSATCKNKHRIFKFPCNMDSECVDNADCLSPMNITNNTTVEALHLDIPTNTPNYKICWCREGYSPNEDDHCSNMATILQSSIVLLLTTLQALMPSQV